MKNQARLQHNGETFLVWQDSASNWCFTYGNLDSVNTGHKELQPALNCIHESIEDKLRPFPKKRREKRQPKKQESLLDKLGI